MAKKYALPSMEHEFQVQIVGKDSGLNWVGDFKYVRPNIGTRGQIDVMRAQLNRDLQTIDEETQIVHSAIAHLRHTLTSYPEWWGEADHGASLYDTNVLMDVYNKCIDFEMDWREKVHGGDSEEVEVGNETKKKYARTKRSTVSV